MLLIFFVFPAAEICSSSLAAAALCYARPQNQRVQTAAIALSRYFLLVTAAT
jgi:hypothetical protein